MVLWLQIFAHNIDNGKFSPLFWWKFQQSPTSSTSAIKSWFQSKFCKFIKRFYFRFCRTVRLCHTQSLFWTTKRLILTKIWTAPVPTSSLLFSYTLVNINYQITKRNPVNILHSIEQYAYQWVSCIVTFPYGERIHFQTSNGWRLASYCTYISRHLCSHLITWLCAVSFKDFHSVGILQCVSFDAAADCQQFWARMANRAFSIRVGVASICHHWNMQMGGAEVSHYTTYCNEYFCVSNRFSIL